MTRSAATYALPPTVTPGPTPRPEVVISEGRFLSYEGRILSFNRGDDVLSVDVGPGESPALIRKEGPNYSKMSPVDYPPDSHVTLYTTWRGSEEVITSVLYIIPDAPSEQPDVDIGEC